MTHAFDEAIAVTVADGGAVFHATSHPAWGNMVGPFGGITAATVVAALQRHPDSQGDPLALTLNYVAPIGTDDWRLHATVVRTNRTNQHWTLHLEQDGRTVATGTAVLGTRRDTWADTEAAPPAAGAPADHPVSAFPSMIRWAQNYEIRFTAGALDPATGPADDSTTTMWLRDLPQRPLDFPALASMSDAFYPRAFLRRGTYLPAGTISLTTYFHATAEDLRRQGTEPVLATARAARFGYGHFDQYGQLWGTDGTLLATTHQLVYFKDPRG